MSASYSKATFGRDFLASVVVFLVALPLCMGISLASGMPPTAGIITGIVGGIVVGMISGAPLQVSGPAAGLSVLVWQLVDQFGLQMIGVIVLFAGLIQLVAGLCKLGQWFRAVSPAVINGMLAGIGVLILASQFHVMLDYKPIGNGLQNLFGIPTSLMNAISEGGTHVQALGIGVLTIATIFAWSGFAPKSWRLFPAPLVGAIVGIGAAMLLGFTDIKYVDVPDNIWSTTIFPTPEKLWRITEWPVLVGAISIAFIASAETLLCATAVDQMHKGPRTKYDRELAAQGVGNTICGFLGVLPMTGVIVRSGANVEAGAETRASAIMHGVWLLLFVSALPFTLRYIPLSALAAILVLHRLQARLSEDRPDAAQVRQGRSVHLLRDDHHDRGDEPLGRRAGRPRPVAHQAALRLLAPRRAQGGERQQRRSLPEGFGDAHPPAEARGRAGEAEAGRQRDGAHRRSRLHRPCLPRPAGQLGSPVRGDRRQRDGRVGRIGEASITQRRPANIKAAREAAAKAGAWAGPTPASRT